MVAWSRKWALLCVAAAGSTFCGSPSPAPSPSADLMHLTIPRQTVHNSHYLSSAFLYQLQTLLAGRHESPSVMSGSLVHREGKELYLDLAQWPAQHLAVIRNIAAQQDPRNEMSLDEIDSYMEKHYYEITRPYPSLDVLLQEHSYRENLAWLTVPVQSATFHRKRVLRINKDRVADALVSYFGNDNLLLYPEGTLIAAESFDKDGRFVEAEVLRKRDDTFWNFAVYDAAGNLIGESVAFNEEGRRDDSRKGFTVPRDCALCHRVDRLDLSGDAEAPVRSPIRGFFHHLPARVPQIDLGPEYYDHMAFTELTETTARRKDSVFGVYGSLLLSELAGRRRLGTLTEDDRARYQRLQPHYPELLTPLDREETVTNSIGMRLVRIPAPAPGALIGSSSDDRDRAAGEERRPAGFAHSFYLAATEVTNAQFRVFRPAHHSPPYKGVPLDADNQPVAYVDYSDALAFMAWLNALPDEKKAGRSYRLPTEAEWEYAARAGDDRRFPWGDQWPPPARAGNFADEANGQRFQWPYLKQYSDDHLATAPAGSYFPNAFFLYDMAGNVYEWTSSISPGSALPGGQTSANLPVRIVRGSSWADELPKVLRCAFRLPRNPATKWAFLGFRVAADAPAASAKTE